MANRDYGKRSGVTKMADGGAVTPAPTPAPAPPQLGGAAGRAQGALRDRGKRIDEAAGYADGGDVGFFERLKAGNIDDAGSEAYNRWGAGKAAGDASELDRESRRTSPGSDSSASAAPAPAPAPTPAPAPAPAEEPAPREASNDEVRKMADDAEAAAAAPKPKKYSAARKAIYAAGQALVNGSAAKAGQKAPSYASKPFEDNFPTSSDDKPRKPLEGVMSQLDPNTLLPKTQMANGGVVGGPKHYGKKQ